MVLCDYLCNRAVAIFSGDDLVLLPRAVDSDDHQRRSAFWDSDGLILGRADHGADDFDRQNKKRGVRI